MKLSRKQENINKLKMTNQKIKSEPKTASKKKRVFYQSAKISPRGLNIDQGGSISEEDIIRRSLASGLSKFRVPTSQSKIRK